MRTLNHRHAENAKRAAVTAFRDRYNRHRRLENEASAKPKTGLHALEARQADAMKKAA